MNPSDLPKLKTRRLANAFGAEIMDVDLRERLDDATIASIRAAWNEYGILLIRNQDLSARQLIDYSRRFGELDLHETVKPLRHQEVPELAVLSTIPVDGKPSPTERVGRHWHSDLSYTTRPPLGSIFHAQILPEIGGDTLFASTAAAYDALSDTMKKVIEPLWAVHDYMQVESMKRRDPAIVAELGRNNPPVAQPIVRVHEETGRKTLYVGDQLTRRIVGMTMRESAPLLKFLSEHIVDPLFTFRQKWQKNDVIMWDNRSTMHLALADFPPGSHRYCVRTTVLGSPSGHYYQG
jgi:taurine dioxygenase